MKHLMRYEGFTPQQRQDEILDKISKYGIASLTIQEKEFLDSYSNGNTEEIHKKLNFTENEVVFEDDSGNFKFEFLLMENYGNEKHLVGILYVPDLIWENGAKVEGRLEGRIIDYGNGQISPDFSITIKDVHKKIQKDITYDIFEFCNGLEYELDSFLDYVVSEIENTGF